MIYFHTNNEQRSIGTKIIMFGISFRSDFIFYLLPNSKHKTITAIHRDGYIILFYFAILTAGGYFE